MAFFCFFKNLFFFFIPLTHSPLPLDLRRRVQGIESTFYGKFWPLSVAKNELWNCTRLPHKLCPIWWNWFHFLCFCKVGCWQNNCGRHRICWVLAVIELQLNNFVKRASFLFDSLCPQHCSPLHSLSSLRLLLFLLTPFCALLHLQCLSLSVGEEF